MSGGDAGSNLAYDLALLLFRGIINVFFREVRPRGSFNIPRDGPVIFVGAPHSNQFLDLLLALQAYRESGRRPAFLVAEKSMRRRVIGFLAKSLSSIPVARAADSAKAGTGSVYLSPDDPCLVLGQGTKFLEEFKPKMQIMLSKVVNSSTAEVMEVISDTQLRIKSEFRNETEKTTTSIREKAEGAKSQGIDGLSFKSLPYIDQNEMYHHVYQQLQDGGCIAIYPEGGSHDRPDLLPLKAGFAMMALGAMAGDPNVKVKIVPVGLSYFHAHRFRSRAVIEFGPPLDIASELVEQFKNGGSEKRQAVSQLLDQVYNALKAVTVRAPDYDTLMLIQAARRLYQPPGQHLTLGQVVELNKRFLHAYSCFKDKPSVQALREKVLKYNRLLRDLGLRDHQVPRAQTASWKTFGLFLYRICLLLVWAVFSLPGVVLHAPIFITASIVSKTKAKEALAASAVKIAGRDVLATWKVLISLVMTPALYVFYAFVATVVAVEADAPLNWILWTPFITLLALPCIGYAALKFGEAGMDVLKSLGPLIIALVPGKNQYLLERLKRMRQELAKELGEAIDEFGPQIWDDFDKNRVVVPSASVPPSSGTPGLWRRKSGVGAVDAQGNLLSHPMTWLDERLFGWSHSAETSRDVSRATSRQGSDNEDAGDYDDLLKVPQSEGTSFQGHRGSYADLQRLRATGKTD